ncbi:glycoside hydrolase superfamily [Xylogone sp. PMI_703]|nr:glycoside hydrolase superfamily [Xylogone sp. PMI_703]
MNTPLLSRASAWAKLAALAVLVPLAGAEAFKRQNSCLPAYVANIETYKGCFKDDATIRDLPDVFLSLAGTNTPQVCVQQCGSRGYSYAGVEFGEQCFCGNDIGSKGVQSPESECNMPCAGNSSQSCGQAYYINIYQISNPLSPPRVASVPDCTRLPLCGNAVCETSLSIEDRAAALVGAMTLQEKISNMGSTSHGVPRLGVPSFGWDSEASHGVAGSSAVFWGGDGYDFSYATSFAAPINLAASFDDSMVNSIGTQVGTEARAFFNYGYSGLSFMAPNINPFRDPRWGRGLETPGEDIFVVESFARNYVLGMQSGATTPSDSPRIIAACKHLAVYDIEAGRASNNLAPPAQDYAEYYLPVFQVCARDAQVLSIMTAYNAAYGVPSAASRYQMQEIMRESFGFNKSYNFFIGDCSSVEDILAYHHYVDTYPEASALALNAGVDVDCGNGYQDYLNVSIALNMTTEAVLDKRLETLYSSLLRAGYFTPSQNQQAYSWSDVSTPAAEKLAYASAVESIVLLKNNGVLPIRDIASLKVALIGPLAEATTQMQGNYYGNAPYLVSPLAAFQNHSSTVSFQQGTGVTTASSTNASAAVSLAQDSDVIIYIGGIDTTVEAEALDRSSIEMPANQTSFIQQLAKLGKPLVVVEFGAGQVDDSALLSDTGVDAILWVGYPGQSGGTAIYDIISGAVAPAGRLASSKYPSSFTSEVSLFDMSLRPTSTSPGRTYKWYTGNLIKPFGFGMHYTNFDVSWASKPATSFNIQQIISGASSPVDLHTVLTLNVAVKNAGGLASVTSDYVALLFASSNNAGPTPRPIKTLVSYSRAHNIAVGQSQTLNLPVTIRSLLRADTNGDQYLYPGTYQLALDVDSTITFNFTLAGTAALIQALPRLPANQTGFEDLGCYSGAVTSVLTGGTQPKVQGNAPQSCVDVCHGLGYVYSGVQSSQCVCAHQIASGAKQATITQCKTISCPGDPLEFCGGQGFTRVFNSSIPTNPLTVTTSSQ